MREELERQVAGWLQQIMPNLPRVTRELYAPHLLAAMYEFEITNERRIAAFLGQLAHESQELRTWQENLNYSAKRLTEVWPKRFPTLAAAARYAHNPEALAEKTYGGRMGNTQPGDGYRFRGRSPVHLTGRENYAEVSAALGVDLVADPDKALRPDVGFRIAAYFWKAAGLNPLADARKFKTITIRINGGLTGYAERVKYYERALRVIPDDLVLTEAARVPDAEDSDVHAEIAGISVVQSDESSEPFRTVVDEEPPARGVARTEAVLPDGSPEPELPQPASPEDVREMVRKLREAGVEVGANPPTYLGRTTDGGQVWSNLRIPNASVESVMPFEKIRETVERGRGVAEQPAAPRGDKGDAPPFKVTNSWIARTYAAIPSVPAIFAAIKGFMEGRDRLLITGMVCLTVILLAMLVRNIFIERERMRIAADPDLNNVK